MFGNNLGEYADSVPLPEYSLIYGTYQAQPRKVNVRCSTPSHTLALHMTTTKGTTIAVLGMRCKEIGERNSFQPFCMGSVGELTSLFISWV